MGEGLRDCPKGSMHAIEKVRVLQRKLYRAAKARPERTFGVLCEKVYSKEVLSYAWEQVRRNRGSAGIDNETIEDIEAYGVEHVLDELQEELRTGRYRPHPVRRVFIPKPDGRQRPLGIPRVRDRIVQAAVRAVNEPLFEASFRPGSFGFRPKRGARQAIEEIRKWVNFGYGEVIDLDLKSYFEEGFDFLGVHFRKQPTRRDRRRSACYAWPSQRSMKRIRTRCGRSSIAMIARPLRRSSNNSTRSFVGGGTTSAGSTRLDTSGRWTFTSATSSAGGCAGNTSAWVGRLGARPRPSS